MRFDEAFKAMKQGAKVKLPSWGGYWYWSKEKQTIIIHTKDGIEMDIRETQVPDYTFSNIACDDWVLADEQNCPELGGVNTFSFGEAIKYMKRGMKVARRGWNGKGMYVFLITEDVATKSLGNAFERKMNPYLCIKNVNESLSTWVPSINDCLSEDWVFVN